MDENGVLSDGLALDEDLQDYVMGCSGIGPHADTWEDKPHRLVYDLVMLCQKARNQRTRGDWENLEEFGRLID